MLAQQLHFRSIAFIFHHPCCRRGTLSGRFTDFFWTITDRFLVVILLFSFPSSSGHRSFRRRACIHIFTRPREKMIQTFPVHPISVMHVLCTLRLGYMHSTQCTTLLMLYLSNNNFHEALSERNCQNADGFEQSVFSQTVLVVHEWDKHHLNQQLQNKHVPLYIWQQHHIRALAFTVHGMFFIDTNNRKLVPVTVVFHVYNFARKLLGFSLLIFPPLAWHQQWIFNFFQPLYPVLTVCFTWSAAQFASLCVCVARHNLHEYLSDFRLISRAPRGWNSFIQSFWLTVTIYVIYVFYLKKRGFLFSLRRFFDLWVIHPRIFVVCDYPTPDQLYSYT